MRRRIAPAPEARLLSSRVEFQPIEAPAVRQSRMAVSIAASAMLHAALLGTLVVVLHGERRRPPIIRPVSLVSLPGGGGGGGGGGSPEAPAAPPSPAPPAPAPEPARPAAETPRPAPPPVPVARPKTPAKPSSAPRTDVASAHVPAGSATSGGGQTPGGAAGTGGGDGTGGGGAGFTGASAGYGVNPLPPYPIAARRLRFEGEVLLRVVVAADGRPTSVVVLKSSGHDMLDASAVDTVRTRWRFVPATRNGVPVEDTVQVPIRFRQSEG
jgi:protein TonB